MLCAAVVCCVLCAVCCAVSVCCVLRCVLFASYRELYILRVTYDYTTQVSGRLLHIRVTAWHLQGISYGGVRTSLTDWLWPRIDTPDWSSASLSTHKFNTGSLYK